MLLHFFTTVHVLISLVGILTGIVAVAGFIANKPLGAWNSLFLVTTFLTSATGFLFPVHHFLPSQGVGIVSLLVLGIAWYGLRRRHLAGPWKKTYVVSATTALYLNVFVGVVQSFLKLPTLHTLAPTQTETPFKVAQAGLLFVFLLLGLVAAMRFHPEQRLNPQD